jgi:4-amino-4-deoxy-L-arabinose transferase-like glycosyltransferase
MLRRIFDPKVALWSAVSFALFGFHVAYSVTTSSEGPTIFFLMLGLYAWMRFYFENGWRWLVLSGAWFSAASLCRVEVWLYLPVLAIGLLVLSGGAIAQPTSRSWLRLTVFTLAAAPGAAGWLIYSWLKWGEPLHAANRSAWLSAHFNIHQSLLNRLVAVPGALFVTLSPPVLLLALLGLLRIRDAAEPLVMVPAVLALVLGGTNFILAITKNSTMARYTLMYSWLLIPYAFYELRALSSRWPWVSSRATFAGLLMFFLLWQAGIVAGAYYGPAKLADKLSSVSPTLPLSVELRHLVRWLVAHRAPDEAVIFDDFNYEASDVIRFARIPSSEYFQVPYQVDPATVQEELRDFVVNRRPRFLVYSPSGLLRGIWSIDRPGRILDDSSIALSREWQEGNWQVYRISYEGDP